MQSEAIGTLTDVIEVLGLPADSVVEPAAGGASGSAWRVRASGVSYVLRLSPSVPLTDGRIAAMAAARAAGLPAPELVARARLPDHEAVLLSWLPGITLLDAVALTAADAPRLGRLMGEMQRQLHEVPAPRELAAAATDRVHPFSAGRAVRALPRGDALIHLDWHPLNLLVDSERRTISGIVDWDNARRGHPLLDLARTHSILTLEPSLGSLPSHVRAVLGSLLESWAAGYGAPAHAIPPTAQRWAARVMLADLESRYAATPELLDSVRRSAELVPRRS